MTKKIETELKINNEMILNELKIVKHFFKEDQNARINKLNLNAKRFEISSIKDADELIKLRKEGSMKLF